MQSEQEIAGTLSDIKKMMQRSSRFISLSGWSGISAGICALAGAAVAYPIVENSSYEVIRLRDSFQQDSFSLAAYMDSALFRIALVTFLCALILSFFFTWLRSRKSNTPLWGFNARRLLLNMLIPIAAGGFYLLKLMEAGAYGYIAPGCLLVYGLALLNASKYTLDEVRYLGYVQILLAVVNLFFTGYGLYFWALGFGVMHIVYGIIMWYKYERIPVEESE